MKTEDENPLRTGLNSPDDKVLKLTVKDYPLSKENDAIPGYLQHLYKTYTVWSDP